MLQPRTKKRARKESTSWAIMGVVVLAIVQCYRLGIYVPSDLKQLLIAPCLAFAFHYKAFMYGVKTGSVSLLYTFYVTIGSFILLAEVKVDVAYYAFTDYELFLICLVNGGSFFAGAVNGARCRNGK
jgi:hypothetical protein